MRFAFDRSPGQTLFALIAILALAAQVRVFGIGWDGFAGLHPDERHLFFVTHEMFRALADPAHEGRGWAEWWFSHLSPLNPHWGDKFYVYGELPVLSGALLGRAFGATDWFAFMDLSRHLSVTLDVATVLAVFLGARLVSGNAGGLFAAILYAAMPTALQLANFHTVDVWLSATVAAAMVPLLAIATGRMAPLGLLRMAGLAGVFIGLALASKVTGVLLAGPAFVALVCALRAGVPARRVVLAAAMGLVFTFISFRLANPFAFEGPGLFGLRPSEHWIKDFAQLLRDSASPDFPPNWQWMAGYGLWPFLRDLMLFGAGPVAAGLALLGVTRKAVWQGGQITALAGFALYLVYAASSSASALRYAAPGLAPLAMALAPLAANLPRRGALVLVALALWWGAGAARLHDGQHPRVAASHWLWTLPEGTVLMNETGWDEGLPVIVSLAPGEPFRWPGHDNWFSLRELDITAPDSPEKADRMANSLAQADFLILSSDRQSAVMPRLADRFPLTRAHYAALFGGRACFAPVLEIDRGYPLPGLRLNDAWAQEPWRVYDHPVVRIFRREPCFDPAAYAAFLKAALPTP